jgi:glucose-fructose oxidoreductase
MAVTVRDCEAMIEATEEANVRLMIAYRLHFEEANMRAMEVVRSGKIGEPRFFVSSFSNRVDEPDNIRLGPLSEGGGTLYDIGIYCINAARYLFRDEPVEVTALASMGNGRFADCDETTSAILRFSDDRLATFTTSFAAADHDYYQVFGTEGNLLVRPAFGFHDGLGHILEIGDNTHMEHFQCRDQVAAELLHFADAILEGHAPEPSGDEGLADVTIIEALLESASSGRSVEVKPRLLSASTARRDRRGHPSSRSVPVRAR